MSTSIRTGLLAACVAAAFAAPAAQAQNTQTVSGDAKAAQGKVSMCTGCHGIPGYRTAYPKVYHVPKIGGQQPVYIVNALKAYKSGERSHPTMLGIAGSLTEQDMADLAAYYGAKK
jgi:cytochrome c553